MSSFAGIDDVLRAADLPKPVARYFQCALPPGGRLIARVRLTQEGSFRLGTGESSWRPFTATQTFTARPPGFTWDARIRLVPGIDVRVRDAYENGAGSIEATCLRYIRLARARGTPELASGALQRYLAEAVWFPTRLLPGCGVSWEALDEDQARVTLIDGATTASLVLQFNPDGTVARLFTPSRFREVKGRYVPTPWEAVCAAHEDRGGFTIPAEAEVAWQIDRRRIPYWRGRVTEASYELAD